MGISENVKSVKDFFTAIDRGDEERLQALVAEDIESRYRYSPRYLVYMKCVIDSR